MRGTPVREATPDDLPALRAIQATALAEPWPALLGIAVDGPPVLLVYADPTPAGYALAIAGDAEPDASPADPDASPADANGDGREGVERDVGGGVGPTGRRGAYLAELAVAAPRRGEGCGSTLLSALVDRLGREGFERLRVTVREADERAVAFYRARGFTVEARLPGHYESGDGRLLVRRLDG